MIEEPSPEIIEEIEVEKPKWDWVTSDK